MPRPLSSQRITSRRVRVVCISAGALCLAVHACGVDEGPLLVRDAVLDAGSDAGRPPLRAAVRSGMTLQYQITGQLDSQVDAQLFIIDLFDSSQAQVADLHAAGRVVIAYVSVGSLESWRDDASDVSASAVGMSLQGYPDERWLDIRSADVRSLMQQRFERAVGKGFDGVFASTLGAYTESSGFALTQADELGYDQFLATTAHAGGLSIGLSGDFELGKTLAGAFDWALTIGCIADDDCDALAPLRARNRPLFDLETEGDHDTICKQATSDGLPVTFKHTSFDAYRVTCP